jgi:hypothetical protein
LTSANRRGAGIGIGRHGVDGIVLVLANDGSYWRPGCGDKDTNAAAFRLGEGTVLNGRRAWGSRTGAGTRKGREKVLIFSAAYKLHWVDYSTFPGGTPGATFRLLAIEIATPIGEGQN